MPARQTRQAASLPLLDCQLSISTGFAIADFQLSIERPQEAQLEIGNRQLKIWFGFNPMPSYPALL
jgi:hypothetical protein